MIFVRNSNAFNRKDRKARKEERFQEQSVNHFSKLAKGFVGILLTVLFVLLGTAGWSSPKPKALRIYFVDVEGGQATLFVTPAAESLLIDTGWPGFDGRDADRIVAAAKAAGISKIDYV